MYEFKSDSSIENTKNWFGLLMPPTVGRKSLSFAINRVCLLTPLPKRKVTNPPESILQPKQSDRALSVTRKI